MTVSHPPRHADMQLEIEIAQRDAKMNVLEVQNRRMAIQLQEIFDGIARGEQVDLVYPDGSVVAITKARKRGEAG